MTREQVIATLKSIYDGDRMSDAAHHYTPEPDEEINIMATWLPAEAKPILDDLKNEGIIEDWEQDDDGEIHCYNVNKKYFETV